MTRLVPHAPGALDSNLIHFGDPELVDVLLRCDEKAWAVHAYVVCTESSYLKFARAHAPTDDGFRVIQLLDKNSAPAIHRVLEYTYHDDYDDDEDFSVKHTKAQPQSLELALVSTQTTETSDSTTASTSDRAESPSTATALDCQNHTSSFIIQRLMNNLSVYVVAEQFDMAGLKAKAEEKFERLVLEAWPLDDFALIAQSTFEIASEDLQQHVTAVCMQHLAYLMGREDFREVLCQVAELASDLLAHLVDHNEDTRTALSEKLNDVESSHQAELAALGEKHLRQIESLEAEHAKEIEDLRKTSAEQVAQFQDIAVKLGAVIDKHIGRTGGAIFTRCIETERGASAASHFQSITFVGAYEALSFEELRIVETKLQNTLPLKLETLIRENASMVSALRSEISRLEDLVNEKRMEASEAEKTIARLTQNPRADPKLKEEINQLKDSVTKHSAAELAWKSEADRLNQKLLAFIAEANKGGKCRHCRENFSGHFELEKYGDGTKYSFRCSYCRTRHGNLEAL